MKSLLLFAHLAAVSMMPSFACIERTTKPEIRFTGCTPAGEHLKTRLGIDPGTAIDYFRWDLRLQPATENNGQFTLLVSYGEGQPNTQKFKNGGETRSLTGSYELSGDLLKLSGVNQEIRFRKIDENIMHLLSSGEELMVGNGGWSYTICRTEPVRAALSRSAIPYDLIQKNDTSTQIEFQGRTPCQAIAKQLKLHVSHECWKMKWLMILKRDPQTPEANTFQLRQTNINGDILQGSWEARRTEAGNILVLKMKNAGQDCQLQFLVGDENVLFILDEQLHPLVGNSEFSFTLNRKMPLLP